MKRISILFIILMPCFSWAIDRYGGQYNVVLDTSPYTFHYRFMVDPGQTGVNDFEYRSQMDDIYAIWNATTSISECDRWRTVNELLEKRVDPYITYPVGVFRSSIPFDSTSLVYYSTSDAVFFYLVSTSAVDSTKFYSNIKICNEGEALPF